MVPGAATLATSVPLDAVAGGVAPAARRIITPARSPAPGFVHDSETVVAVFVAPTPVTGPGGVVSGVSVLPDTVADVA